MLLQNSQTSQMSCTDSTVDTRKGPRMDLNGLCWAAGVQKNAQAHNWHQCKLQTFRTRARIQQVNAADASLLKLSRVPVNPTGTIVSACQHVWALPVEMCGAGGCMKTLSESAGLVFTLRSSTAVTPEEDEVILFIAQLLLMKLCLAP